MLSHKVIGIIQELWDYVIARERYPRIHQTKSYNFEEIVNEKLADKRVLIRHNVYIG